MKTWAQICKHKHFYIGCLKTQQKLGTWGKKIITTNVIISFFNNSGRALVNRAGLKPVRAGRSALINMPSWNTGIRLAAKTLRAGVLQSIHKHWFMVLLAGVIFFQCLAADMYVFSVGSFSSTPPPPPPTTATTATPHNVTGDP